MVCFLSCVTQSFPFDNPDQFELSCVQLLANPWTVSCQASLSMGISPARILEWIAKPSSSASSQPSYWTCVSCIAGAFFTAEPSGKPFHWVTVPQFNEKYPIDPFHSLTVSTVLEKNFIHFFGCLSGKKVSHSVVSNSLQPPLTIQSMEFSRPGYWGG